MMAQTKPRLVILISIGWVGEERTFSAVLFPSFLHSRLIIQRIRDSPCSELRKLSRSDMIAMIQHSVVIKRDCFGRYVLSLLRTLICSRNRDENIPDEVLTMLSLLWTFIASHYLERSCAQKGKQTS